MSARALPSVRLLGSLHSDAERMAHWIARSSPVRVGVRADELAGLRTRAGGSSKRGKVMVRTAGFEKEMIMLQFPDRRAQDGVGILPSG